MLGYAITNEELIATIFLLSNCLTIMLLDCVLVRNIKTTPSLKCSLKNKEMQHGDHLKPAIMEDLALIWQPPWPLSSASIAHGSFSGQRNTSCVCREWHSSMKLNRQCKDHVSAAYVSGISCQEWAENCTWLTVQHADQCAFGCRCSIRLQAVVVVLYFFIHSQSRSYYSSQKAKVSFCPWFPCVCACWLFHKYRKIGGNLWNWVPVNVFVLLYRKFHLSKRQSRRVLRSVSEGRCHLFSFWSDTKCINASTA